MSNQKLPHTELELRMKEAEELIHALRTRQVDAIIGKRHIMLVRLQQVEESLKNSRNQLRTLAAYLLSVRENERTEIARELHDEFGQALTSLQLGLTWISRGLTRDQRPLQKKVKSLSATATSLIRSVKNIARKLRPGALDELGLVRTLKSEAREFEGHTGIPCSFETNAAKTKFDRSAAVAIFRIVQGALTNIARHAHASRARITLIKNRSGVILTVADNGKGITTKQVFSHNSLGITGMRERTFAFGGTFTLTGTRSKGTVLTVRMPLSRIAVRKIPQSVTQGSQI